MTTEELRRWHTCRKRWLTRGIRARVLTGEGGIGASKAIGRFFGRGGQADDLLCSRWHPIVKDGIATSKRCMQLLFLSVGVLSTLLFHDGVYLPVAVSAAILALAVWHLIRLYRQSRVGLLTIVLFVAYALPFMHVVPYIWFDFEAPSPLIMWGLAARPYMTDKTIVELMSMIGAVGAAGFMTGTLLVRKRRSVVPSPDGMEDRCLCGRTLSLPVFVAGVVLSILLTWISAPADTIFTAAYTTSRAMSDNWNFSSAWMFSYVFLLFALADSMFDASPRTGRLKRKIVLCAFLLIVVWFQLLRGDRESLPCVIGALLMYYVWGKGLPGAARGRIRIKSPVLILSLFLVAGASYLFGSIRSSAVGVGSTSDLLGLFRVLAENGTIRVDNLICGTWSGVLLTPISVAGDYIKGMLPIQYGQTYLDLLASIVPGFWADAIGYARPIDSFHGPAWQMTYGLGGTHAVVVPFMNFHMAGVFVIIALWSFVCARIERHSINRLTVPNLALLGILAMTAPHWLWYGEKYIMNALIIWLLVSIVYRLRLSTSSTGFLGEAYQLSGSSS